jgi:anaerobic magnesium-protoporphyrin IX monomethyl ester cyclase
LNSKKNRVVLIAFLSHSINIRELASYIRQNGYQVTCIFCQADFNADNIPLLMHKITELDPFLVGMSLVTDDFPKAVMLTKAIKDNINLPVIWGGAHVNVMPEECLNHADMICMGEGEEALSELLDAYGNDIGLNTSIKNIWFKTKDGIVQNNLRPLEEDLDKYPFPENDTKFLYVLSDHGLEGFTEEHLGGVYNIMTSRGCPYQCDYCYNSYRKKQYLGLGRYLRMRSIENVIEELKTALKLFPGLRYVQFWDDCFIARTVDELQHFKELYVEHINLPFFALIEPMIFDYQKIKILKECGLQHLQVGIQTGSERVNREVFNRRASKEKMLETAQYINELEIKVVYDLIFNNPYETTEDIKETIDLILKFPRPFQLQGYNLIFYPGTKITERALADGHISPNYDLKKSLTIQSRENSPISMGGRGRISDRFYKINYSSDHKLYWNSVVSLLASNYIPKPIICFFGRSESPFKKVGLKIFVRLYAAGASIKHFFDWMRNAP